MIEKGDIFKKTVDIYKLLEYIVSREYKFCDEGTSVTIDGVMLNSEAAMIVIMDDRTRGLGIDNHVLGGRYRILSDNTLKFDELRLVIH